jgi:hypothetical protein
VKAQLLVDVDDGNQLSMRRFAAGTVVEVYEATGLPRDYLGLIVYWMTDADIGLHAGQFTLLNEDDIARRRRVLLDRIERYSKKAVQLADDLATVRRVLAEAQEQLEDPRTR